VLQRSSDTSANVYAVNLDTPCAFGSSHVILKHSKDGYSEIFSELDFYEMQKEMQGNGIAHALEAKWTFVDDTQEEGIVMSWAGRHINLQSLSDEQRKNYSTQLRKIYGRMSEHGIIHNDQENFKGNWLERDGKISVIDFNRSCKSDEMFDVPPVKANAHTLYAMLRKSGLLQEDMGLETIQDCAKWLHVPYKGD
jgi:thiamine kinase-like enzyme